MSVLRQEFENLGGAQRFGVSFDLIQVIVAPLAWRWYRAHENDVLLSVGKWFIRFNVRVRDLRPLFVTLFGEEPNAQVQ